MPNITLPDGSVRSFKDAISVADIALDIGEGLARAAIGGKVEGSLVDLSFVIERDVNLSIITSKNAEGLDIIRHSTAHLIYLLLRRKMLKVWILFDIQPPIY